MNIFCKKILKNRNYQNKLYNIYGGRKNLNIPKNFSKNLSNNNILVIKLCGKWK